MSLEQKSKKIKYFLQFLLLVEVLIFLYFVYLIDSFNQRRLPVLIYHDAFAMDFNNLAVAESGISDDKVDILDGNSGEEAVFDSETHQIAAAKTGSKYYYPNCAGLKRIKVENLVYFASESEAEKAGYELAKNCEK